MGGMRLPVWSRAAPLVLVAAVVLLTACGRSGYQYVENADDTVFIKIPEDWSVVSEGTVNFSLTPDEDIQPIPGEFVLPWRAEFDAAPGGVRGSSEYVQGSVEIQPVDRRGHRASLPQWCSRDLSCRMEGPNRGWNSSGSLIWTREVDRTVTLGTPAVTCNCPAFPLPPQWSQALDFSGPGTGSNRRPVINRGDGESGRRR